MPSNFNLTPQGDKLFQTLQEMNDLEIFVGFQSGQKAGKRGKSGQVEESTADLVTVAAWNEFGTKKIPARPFMQQTMDKHGDDVSKFSYQCVQAVVMGKLDLKTAANRLGAYVKGLVQQTIRDGEFAPNAPSTIRKKGSDHPLIDTGHMRQSVNYVVRKKGSGGG